MTPTLTPIDKTSRYLLRPKSDRANKQVRRPGASYKPKARAPSVAPPITYCAASTTGTYRTGDGDTVSALRPGALDALRCPSRGHV